MGMSTATTMTEVRVDELILPAAAPAEAALTAMVGEFVNVIVGSGEGGDGGFQGANVRRVGSIVGATEVGASDGRGEGRTEGRAEGAVGSTDGRGVGWRGRVVGPAEGGAVFINVHALLDGHRVGSKIGCMLGGVHVGLGVGRKAVRIPVREAVVCFG